MLHLAVIGIVCAVSAPSEGTAFIGRKNNESVFCHIEGEQNVAKVFLPNYNVDVFNSYDCAKQKITNRTSSFFYDYIVKQCQNSKNSSCSIIKNAFLEKEKKPHSNVEFAFKKRNLLWVHHNSKFSTKTLRPVMENRNFEIKKPKYKNDRPKKFREKISAKADRKPTTLNEKCNLNFEQKKILLRLKKIKRRPEKEKLCLKNLNRIKVVDELDLNKRIEKLVKEVALENQQKEKYFANDYAFIKNPKKDKTDGFSNGKKIKESIFKSIKNLFCFRKNHFKDKKREIRNVNSFFVNKVRDKDPVAEKMALTSNFDISKTKRKSTRFKRNPYGSFDYFSNSAPINRQNFIEVPYPYSANSMAKRCLLHPPGIRQFVPENEIMRLRPRNSLENWPFFKKLYFNQRSIHDSRLKRYDMHTEKLTELPATKEKDSITMLSSEDVKTEKTSVCCTESMNTEKSSTEENDYSKTTEETILSSISLSENIKESTVVNLVDLNVTEGNEEDPHFDHTLEKPFLERNLGSEKFEYHNPDSNSESYYYNSMTDFPISDLNYFPPNLKYKYELPNNEYLRPVRYLKIRHALRNYLIHNNVWSPSKRSLSFGRKKRCGKKRCSMPRKCWRSAPLLCVPYIKKSQEDVLKYLIKVMQQMMGKPLPLKRDIFEKTKFKPYLQKGPYPNCESAPEEEIYECETATVSPPSSQEYFEMCPAPSQPQYYPNPKAYPCPSCLLTPKLYAGSQYPPYLNSAKITPEFLRSFSYANFNPPQQRQYPVPNLWPPEIPFYAPRTVQKQNPVYYEEKFATIPPELTSSASVSVTPASSSTSEANISNSSQIVPAVPACNNTSNINAAKTSFVPKPLAPNVNHELPQSSATTTVAKPTASTDFEGLSPGHSTKSACALYVSNSPVGQEEYFSYTAVPYNRAPECATITNQNSETTSPILSNQQLANYNPAEPHKYQCDACFAKVEYTPPDTQQVLEWPSTTNSLPTTEPFHYESQIKEMPKSYKELYESPQEYSFEDNQFKKDNRNLKYDSNKSIKEDLGKAIQYDDNSQNEHQMLDSENSQKRLFRIKHKKFSKSKEKFQPTEFFPSYDYYMYDKYPLMKSNDNNNMKFGRHSVPQVFWKNYERKMKTISNPKPLIRRKRKDYDSDSDNFENYNDCFDDSNYNDEDSNKYPETYTKGNTKNYFNSEFTPPSYEMLSELAKAITEFNTTKSESTTPMSVATTVGTFDSADQSTKSSLEKSSTNGVTTLQMSKSTSRKPANKVKDSDKRSFLQSNNKPLNFQVFASKSTFTSETDDESFTQASLTTVTVDTKININDRAIDSKKFGKTSFFQSNSKIAQTPKNSKKDGGKENKELEINKNSKTEEDGQIPTTLKAAAIVKGPKKSLTKPSPKIYPKVYPDSFPYDVETNDPFASTVTTVKAFTENRTALLSSTSKPDIRLQLLAVCEGYLEIVKLIKGQNQTTEGDLDADLARYCENIISQSFNNQLEKPKKPELTEFSQQSSNKGGETAEGFLERTDKLNSESQTGYESARDFSESKLREKIIAGTLKNPVFTKKTAAKRNETNGETSENNSNSNNNNDDDDDDDDDDDNDNDNENCMSDDEIENDDSNNDNDNNITKKNEENFTEIKTSDSTEVTEVSTKREKNNCFLTECLIKKQRKRRRKEETEKQLLKKGLSKEEIELLQILRKRKKALLSWLFNLEKQHNFDDLEETEYFDDEDRVTKAEPLKNSGTIKPKTGESKAGRTKKNLLFDNAESDFPIYAKRYGYDKGGEIREVEVLWRKINEKTHEEKIFKNISLLALFMTSPDMSHDDTKFVVNNGYENEDMSEVEVNNENEIGYAADAAETNEQKTTEPEILMSSNISNVTSSSTPPTTASTKSTRSNLTHTFISKPDSSSIVGECPKVKKSHQNTTRKTSRKMEVAKDLFQEYTIEFVNYAVYILPIMLTIIFLFCCWCCALHILKTQQSLQRYRKKKKKQFTTDETSESTEESGLHLKKKKREVKFKRKSKKPESDAGSDKTERKKFWNVLKLSSKPSNDLKNENFRKGKKNIFLRFLKDKKKKKYLESDYLALGANKKGDEESPRTDNRSEAAERRELIALLEEVKKIEMEHIGDKKEVNSVPVQYMTQENDGSVLQRPDVLYPYQKNVFGLAKGYSFCTKPYTGQKTDPPTMEDCDFHEDVNELTELLPCECTYLSKKGNCLRHCDFSVNQQDPCKRLLKIFRDSGMCHNRPFNEKNFVKNDGENRSFIFNKYRSISMDPSEELMGVTQKNAGTEIRLTDIASPFALPSQEDAGILKEIDNLKRQLNSKKNVRLKDDGVLCRL